MPFVDKSHYEKQEKAQEIQEKVDMKKQQHFINESAKEKKDKGLDLKSMLKVVKSDMKDRRQLSRPEPAQKPISLSQLKKQLDIQDYIEEKKDEVIMELLDDQETLEIKNEIIHALAMPMSDPVRRRVFRHKLQTSRTINKYVNENVILRMFNRTNDHIKFGAIYAIKYAQTYKDVEEYVQQKSSEQPIQVVESVKEVEEVVVEVAEEEEDE